MSDQPSLFGSAPSAESIPFAPCAVSSSERSEATGCERSALSNLTVKLARNVDAEKPCHDNIAVIHPGTAMIGGVEYKIAAWRRESRSGKKYLSLSFELKEKARGAFRSGADHFNDEIGI